MVCNPLCALSASAFAPASSPPSPSSNLRELLDKFRSSAGDADDGGNASIAISVFASATDLFFYYRETLARGRHELL